MTYYSTIKGLKRIMNISQKSSNFANGIKWRMPKIPQRVGKTKINMIMAQFKVVKIPSDTQHEDERFNAFFYSKDYETIFGKKMNEIKEINRFIKITNGGKEKKAIYLQYRALPGINKREIALNYENTCSLSVKEGNSVVVEPISKITYSWQNLDIIGKVSFSVSIIAFILSLLNMFNII